MTVFKIARIYHSYNLKLQVRYGNEKHSLANEPKIKFEWPVRFLCVQLTSLMLFCPVWLWVLSPHHCRVSWTAQGVVSFL